MSGICGIVDLDGAPVDHAELDRLTAALDSRGPDGRGTRVIGAAGLGKTLLVTTRESAAEAGGPCTLDGRVWIVADARIDGREELRRELAARRRDVPASATDEQLILHAFHAWDEDCVTHLIGDFAFAIWDPRGRRLFCARDHFGVKPFFHARSGRRVVFGNTLAALRGHCAGAALDEQAIGDFLAFGASLDPAATTFAAIRRLPPARCLSITPAQTRERPYWSLPYESTVRYRDADDYVEHFGALLTAAVADRLRAPRANVLMSGGLDSAALAATARRVLSRRDGSELHAHTQVWDDMFPDDEGRFAGAVAQRLDMTIEYQRSGRFGLYDRYRDLAAYFPEPAHEPFAAADVDLAHRAGRTARVALTGWDGDAILSESPRPYFRSLLAQHRLLPLLQGGLRYAWSERKLLPSGTLRRLAPFARAQSAREPALAPWIRPDVARRLGLRERLAERSRPREGPHPVRPHAFAALEYLMGLSSFFESADPGRTGAAVEQRHPMLDLRLVEFCLSLPPYPWCVRKEILRRWIRNELPAEVVARPKTPLGGYAHLVALGREASRWVDLFTPCEELSAYVARDKIPAVCGATDPGAAWTHLRPLSLDLWLRNAARPIAH